MTEEHTQSNPQRVAVIYTYGDSGNGFSGVAVLPRRLPDELLSIYVEFVTQIGGAFVYILHGEGELTVRQYCQREGIEVLPE